MNRNDGGRTPGEVTRVSAIDNTETAIDPGDYWRRTSTKPDNYQFTGDQGDKKVVAATANPSDAAKTYTVKDKDSLWSIANKMVNDSNHKDKSDKFKLDVVKGLVEKNKDSIKGLEANPDKIKGGWTLKVDSVEELAKLGHGKVLHTTYKPPSERKEKESAPKNGETPPEQHRHRGERRERTDYGSAQHRDPMYGDPRYGDQRYGDQRFGDQRYNQRQMDMGPAKEIMGMIGMVAGSAILGNVLGRGNDHHHFRPRPYYDDYGYDRYDRYGGSGYYDGGYYSNPRYPNYQNYRPHQFQQYREPVNYSHYGHPQQNFSMPIQQLQQSQFRIPQIHHHQQQRDWSAQYQQRLQQQQQQQQWRHRNA
ncbi:MAG: hypothetical protein K2Y39_21930 [Candidatus Obscuribacterales bacterium]|nr:hypothetical protein [Candidatus Obscuribacterales bacterium]